MRDIILNFPNQIKEGLKAAGDFKVQKEKYDRIVICGMGGSAMPGMIYLTSQEHKNKGPGVPVIIHSSYDLPSDVTSKDLVICISWSGATEETTSSLKKALEKKIDAVVITNTVRPGDTLAELAQQNNIKTIIVPVDGIAPRFAIGYMTMVLFAILGHAKDLEFSLDANIAENEGKELANKIGSKIPLIYTTYSWRKLGSLWKANFNENSKVPAYFNFLPAMAHNELVMYARKGLPCYPIILKDNNDNPYHLRDLKATIAILDRQEYNYTIVDLSSSTNPLETILNNYILGLWTSYYLAQNLGVNPDDISIIEEFKKLKKEF